MQNLFISSIVAFTCLAHALPSPDPTLNSPQTENPSLANWNSDDLLNTDIVIVGGGAAGTYAAVNLQAQGRKVILIEKGTKLGGPVYTYVDPATGTTVDYGVQAFWNTSVARNYFSSLGVDTTRIGPPPSTNLYVDFETGKPQNVTTGSNYSAYLQQLQKYPELAYSWNISLPLAKDLTLPFGDFVSKYNLQDVAFNLFEAGSGFANYFSQITLKVMKLTGQTYLNSVLQGALVTEARANQEIYDAALEKLGSPNVLLSSTVVAARRPPSGSQSNSGVSLTVSTPNGKKVVNASKLLIAMPPLLENMRPFDLGPAESSLFSQWNYSSYYVMLMNNTGLPAGFRYVNAKADGLYNTPGTPAPYFFAATRIPGVFYVWYTSQQPLTQSEVEAQVSIAVGKVRAKNGNASVGSGAGPTFLEFRDVGPFMLNVPREAIDGGFYPRLYALQGQRNTWYTGAAFSSQQSPVVWNYTLGLLPKLNKS